MSAIQSGHVIGYQALAAGLLVARPARAGRRRRLATRRRQGDPDRRPVGGAVGRGARRRRRDRPGPDAQGPRHPPRRGRRRRAARAGLLRSVSGRLGGRLIALGVTGSIAAYKAVELLRLLQAEGADVVGPALPVGDALRRAAVVRGAGRHPVETDVLDLLPDGRIGHIVVADTADALVVAPATAHWLGAMANGLAGDVVTATCLATSAPVVVAPAMDGEMWTHPATVANVAGSATSFGYAVVEPESGAARVGPERRRAGWPSCRRIVDAVVEAVGDRPVRAPTRRRAPGRRPAARRGPRGPARGRHRRRHRASRSTPSGSSATARPARWASPSPRPRSLAAPGSRSSRGWSVPLPAGARSSGRDDRRDARRSPRPRRPRRRPDHGRSRGRLPAAPAATAEAHPRDEGLTLELEPTPDILAERSPPHRATGARQPRPILVGFAAETGSLERAAEKLRRRASTSSSPTTSRSRAPASAPTRTG